MFRLKVVIYYKKRDKMFQNIFYWDKWGEILPDKLRNDETLINILKIIAPGTKFREGLDNILKAKTGALIIIGDSKEIMDIVDRWI